MPYGPMPNMPSMPGGFGGDEELDGNPMRRPIGTQQMGGPMGGPPGLGQSLITPSSFGGMGGVQGLMQGGLRQPPPMPGAPGVMPPGMPGAGMPPGMGGGMPGQMNPPGVGGGMPGGVNPQAALLARLLGGGQ